MKNIELTGNVNYSAQVFTVPEVRQAQNSDRLYTFDFGGASVIVDDTWKERKGVCQDIVHITLGALREVGIPARYVSGYIETLAPPGKEKLEGSDASHAWISVLAPDGNWVDVDPTNSQVADSRYIVTAWGRDFADVSPLRGVVVTQASTSHLSVGVDVVPMRGDDLPRLSVLGLSLGDRSGG